MITQETAASIWKAYREIEAARALLREVQELEECPADNLAPSVKEASCRTRLFEMGIPSGENSRRLLEVSPVLAESVIRAHIQKKKVELTEANEAARMELDSTS
jgi:hypothetical protein